MDRIIPTLRLGADVEEARAAVSAATATVLADGASAPRLDVVLTGDTLPAQIISALISALRKLRERGGAIVVTSETAGAQAAMRLNGLDRIFALPLVPSDDPPSPARRRRGLGGMVRAAAAAVAAVVAVSGMPAAAQTETVLDPAVILTRVMERNPTLSSYQSRLHVDVRMISFPFLRQHLDGSTYFKRPANYEVVFDRVPSYAKGFSKLYSDVGDPANWEKRFVVTYAGERQFENRKDIELRLVQRVRGQIDHESVLIDPNAYTIDQIAYHYYNGGTITMTQHFSTIAGYSMIASQQADIDIPHVRAVAYGNYTDYQANVAIDDAVFTKKN